MFEELKNFPPIQKWTALGVELDPDKLASSYAKDRFKSPPAPGIHPRVCFNPEDVPVIRQRLQQSRIARTQWELTRGQLLQISPQREDWEIVPYGAKESAVKAPEYLAQAGRSTSTKQPAPCSPSRDMPRLQRLRLHEAAITDRGVASLVQSKAWPVSNSQGPLSATVASNTSSGFQASRNCTCSKHVSPRRQRMR